MKLYFPCMDTTSTLTHEEIEKYKKEAIETDPNRKQRRLTDQPLHEFINQNIDRMNNGNYKIATETTREI